jgi:N-formylglutamate amidohydrolase
MKYFCASMACGPAWQRSDFDLGDRNGTTSGAELAETLSGFGYKVTRNTHFIGAEVVRQHSNPAQGIHGVQIEMNCGLYMDEVARTRGPGFATVQGHLTALAATVAD